LGAPSSNFTLADSRRGVTCGRLGAETAGAEATLIRAAQKGDQEAFERLVRTYDADVLRLAMSLLRSAEDARDIYQEAFLRVWRNLRDFRFDASFQSWLYRIVANLCLDVLRKRKARGHASAVTGNGRLTPDALDILAEPRAEADPQRALFSREVGERVRSALDGLTSRERLVFELRHFHGMRLKEIGEVLGASEEAAKNCLFRATQKMRQALGDFL